MCATYEFSCTCTCTLYMYMYNYAIQAKQLRQVCHSRQSANFQENELNCPERYLNPQSPACMAVALYMLAIHCRTFWEFQDCVAHSIDCADPAWFPQFQCTAAMHIMYIHVYCMLHHSIQTHATGKATRDL